MNYDNPQSARLVLKNGTEIEEIHGIVTGFRATAPDGSIHEWHMDDDEDVPTFVSRVFQEYDEWLAQHNPNPTMIDVQQRILGA